MLDKIADFGGSKLPKFPYQHTILKGGAEVMFAPTIAQNNINGWFTAVPTRAAEEKARRDKFCPTCPLPKTLPLNQPTPIACPLP